MEPDDELAPYYQHTLQSADKLRNSSMTYILDKSHWFWIHITTYYLPSIYLKWLTNVAKDALYSSLHEFFPIHGQKKKILLYGWYFWSNCSTTHWINLDTVVERFGSIDSRKRYMPELFSHISCILICSHLYKDFYPSLKFIIKYQGGREGENPQSFWFGRWCYIWWNNCMERWAKWVLACLHFVICNIEWIVFHASTSN